MADWQWGKRYTVSQIKAARALLEWSQQDLAEASSKSVQTIKRLEALRGRIAGRDTTVQDIMLALEAGGIEFVEEPGGGVGVIFRKPKSRRRSGSTR